MAVSDLLHNVDAIIMYVVYLYQISMPTRAVA